VYCETLDCKQNITVSTTRHYNAIMMLFN